MWKFKLTTGFRQRNPPEKPHTDHPQNAPEPLPLACAWLDCKGGMAQKALARCKPLDLGLFSLQRDTVNTLSPPDKKSSALVGTMGPFCCPGCGNGQWPPSRMASFPADSEEEGPGALQAWPASCTRPWRRRTHMAARSSSALLTVAPVKTGGKHQANPSRGIV
uniref:uncharacterized protein LOC110598862 isoform X2 n=1 Tax=Ictidomys tridecemlineatus TaxID=43179 RepID=UPI001A9F46DD|nr:uncharacterized protein LOC110598862 isoform X2 [Ictidomys tridecemlineatus]